MGAEGKGVESDGCQAQPGKDGTCPKDSLGKSTDNNNLLWVGRVLEEIYNNENLAVPNLWPLTSFPEDIRQYRRAPIKVIPSLQMWPV